MDDTKTQQPGGWQPQTEPFIRGVQGPDPTPYGPVEHFKRWHVSPPTLQYIEVDDTLVLSTYAFGATPPINLSLRVLRADGVIIPYFIPQMSLGSPSAPTVTKQGGIGGFILSATISCPAAAAGQVYAVLEIQRGQGSGDLTMGTVLAAGTPNKFNDVCYPTMPPLNPEALPGYPMVLTVANPAAGADWTYTPAAGTHVTIKNIHAQFVSAAGGPTRSSHIKVLSGATVGADLEANLGIAGGLTVNFNWGHGLPLANTALDQTIIFVPFPLNQRIVPGMSIATATAGIQAGDQWSAIALDLEVNFGL